MRRTKLAVAVVLTLATMANGAKAPVLLLGRAVEASSMGTVANAWFSTLTESYCRLRLQPLDNLELLSPEELKANINRLLESADIRN